MPTHQTIEKQPTHTPHLTFIAKKNKKKTRISLQVQLDIPHALQNKHAQDRLSVLTKCTQSTTHIYTPICTVLYRWYKDTHLHVHVDTHVSTHTYTHMYTYRYTPHTCTDTVHNVCCIYTPCTHTDTQ